MKVGNENIIGLVGNMSLGTQLELLIHLGQYLRSLRLRTPIISSPKL